MPVRVSFVDPVTPERLTEFHTMIEAIPSEDSDSWSVEIRAEGEAVALSLAGPDDHRRIYRVFGEGAYDPIYLAALVRTEVRSRPLYPPQEVAFALAELARLGIPYDDSRILRGLVLVDGEEFSIQTLANLYTNEKLVPRFTGRQ